MNYKFVKALLNLRTVKNSVIEFQNHERMVKQVTYLFICLTHFWSTLKKSNC